MPVALYKIGDQKSTIVPVRVTTIFLTSGHRVEGALGAPALLFLLGFGATAAGPRLPACAVCPGALSPGERQSPEPPRRHPAATPMAPMATAHLERRVRQPLESGRRHGMMPPARPLRRFGLRRVL